MCTPRERFSHRTIGRQPSVALLRRTPACSFDTARGRTTLINITRGQRSVTGNPHEALTGAPARVFPFSAQLALFPSFLMSLSRINGGISRFFRERQIQPGITHEDDVQRTARSIGRWCSVSERLRCRERKNNANQHRPRKAIRQGGPEPVLSRLTPCRSSSLILNELNFEFFSGKEKCHWTRR